MHIGTLDLHMLVMVDPVLMWLPPLLSSSSWRPSTTIEQAPPKATYSFSFAFATVSPNQMTSLTIQSAICMLSGKSR
jgi:hypothetical protein